MRLSVLVSALLLALPVSGLAQAAPDQLPSTFLQNLPHHSLKFPGADGSTGGVLGHTSTGSTLGLDTIPNFSSYFYEPGFTSYGGLQYTWPYTMVGHSPLQSSDGSDPDWNGKTTRLRAPVIPVNLDLRNADGTPRSVNGHRLYLDATVNVGPVLKSPVFQPVSYTSSEDPTQFTDAVQRAEFFNQADSDWHTLLRPTVGTARTMTLLAGTYHFALNGDGSCCAYVLVDENAFLNALFPATPSDTTTPIGAAENSGDIRTRDISTFLFNNVFLYSGTTANCCVIGFHTYDVEPGSKQNGWLEKRYVLNYSSWVSPGIFSDPTFGDIAPLSHELSETFNDPFVANATPWYLAPNGNCQNNLESGDGIEGLPNAQYSIPGFGMVWHPQNEALLQWFAGQTPSSAIQHAYSYPDTSVLTSAATSTTPNCQ